jgi:RNA polymerase sigma factor (sigma-70 family)
MNSPDEDRLGQESPKSLEANSSAFGETQWSAVLNAGHGDLNAAAIALERLCRIYWRPIYAFIRWKRKLDHHQAEDLTQAFFAHLLSHEVLKKVERGKGKFRTFLLAVLDNFLSNESKRGGAIKRGGQSRIISLEEITAGEIYEWEPSQPPTPEEYYDHQWAITLVQRTLVRLRTECAKAGNSERYTKIEPLLTCPDAAESHAELAADLGMTVGAFKVALHRLRGRFREILRAEVVETLASPDEIDEELRHLVTALSM